MYVCVCIYIYIFIASISGPQIAQNFMFTPVYSNKSAQKTRSEYIWGGGGGGSMLQCFVFFLIFAFSCLCFSPLPLPLEILKPRSGLLNECIGYMSIYLYMYTHQTWSGLSEKRSLVLESEEPPQAGTSIFLRPKGLGRGPKIESSHKRLGEGAKGVSYQVASEHGFVDGSQH